MSNDKELIFNSILKTICCKNYIYLKVNPPKFRFMESLLLERTSFTKAQKQFCLASKKKTNILKISALASEMGQNKKIIALYCAN